VKFLKRLEKGKERIQLNGCWLRRRIEPVRLGAVKLLNVMDLSETLVSFSLSVDISLLPFHFQYKPFFFFFKNTTISTIASSFAGARGTLETDQMVALGLRGQAETRDLPLISISLAFCG